MQEGQAVLPQGKLSRLEHSTWMIYMLHYVDRHLNIKRLRRKRQSRRVG
jgi:hypothetical protein